jgi:hypothetical protein
LVHRFPDMQLAVPAAALQFRDLSIVYGVQSLPVNLGISSAGEDAAGSVTDAEQPA